MSNNSADNNDSFDEVTATNPKRKNTPWHWGFVGAMDVELRRAGCDFEFNSEYQSISRSYFIDMFITVNSKPEATDNSDVLGIVKCLRRCTLCEFKPPGETLTIRELIVCGFCVISIILNPQTFPATMWLQCLSFRIIRVWR
jgi:hypothetical protein